MRVSNIPMKLTVKQIKNLYTNTGSSRESDETLQAKYYARPISYRIAWLLIRLGVTANGATILALLIGAAGCVCIGFGAYVSVILGAALLNIGHLLDYVDGTIAKATGTVTNFGMYLDRTCDEVVEAIIPISVGVGLYTGGCTFLWLSPLFYLVLGFSYTVIHLLSTISMLHTRIIYKATHIFYVPKKWNMRWLYNIGVNMKSSMVPTLLLLVVIPGGLPIYLIGFTALTICKLLVVVTTVVRRCE